VYIDVCDTQVNTLNIRSVKCKNALNNEYQSTMYPLVRKLLISLYDTFSLFQGPMDEIATRKGVDGLRHTLDLFFQRYLSSEVWPLKFSTPTSELPPYIPLSIFYALDGIKFLPVQSLFFLHLQSLMNCAMHSFNFPVVENELSEESNIDNNNTATPTNKRQKTIQASLIFFESYLMFNGNGISHTIAKTIAKYLPTLINDRIRVVTMNTTSHANADASNASTSSAEDSGGVFITGPLEFSKLRREGAQNSDNTSSSSNNNNNNSNTRFSAPRLYLKLNEKVEEFYCVVYKYGKFNICLLVRPGAFIDADFYIQLKHVLDREFKRVSAFFTTNPDSSSATGSPVVSRVGTFDEVYKYIYFNRSNLAVKSSGVQNNPRLAVEWNVVADMHRQFITNERKNGLNECYAKVKRDSWVVGKYFGQREFYVVFDQKNFSLVEINDQVHKIQNIFFASTSSSSSSNSSSFD
jgi:hypothetical protein